MLVVKHEWFCLPKRQNKPNCLGFSDFTIGMPWNDNFSVWVKVNRNAIKVFCIFVYFVLWEQINLKSCKGFYPTSFLSFGESILLLQHLNWYLKSVLCYWGYSQLINFSAEFFLVWPMQCPASCFFKQLKGLRKASTNPPPSTSQEMSQSNRKSDGTPSLDRKFNKGRQIQRAQSCGWGEKVNFNHITETEKNTLMI